MYIIYGCGKDSASNTTRNTNDLPSDSLNGTVYYRYIDNWGCNNELSSYIVIDGPNIRIKSFDCITGESSESIQNSNITLSSIAPNYIVYKGDIFSARDTSRDTTYHTYLRAYCIPDQDITPILDLLYVVEIYNKIKILTNP